MVRLKFATLAGLVGLILLSAGCANTVRTRVSTFVEPSVEFGEGSIAVVPADPAQADSLEFAHYRAKLEERLRHEGYQITDISEADFVARASFNVTEEESRRHRYPRTVLMTGFGRYWSPLWSAPPFYYYDRGLHPYDRWAFDPFYGPGFYRLDPWDRRIGPHYWRHNYGFMTDARYPRQEFARRINLTISRVTETDPKPAYEQVYEVTAVSTGGCSSMSAVVDEMLAAIFKTFPGENGAVQTLRVEGEPGCG